mgnify:CR=1 FL=1
MRDGVPTDVPADAAIEPLRRWFTAAGRTPFPFQVQTWQAYLAGQSGLVHAPTGSGKTLAVLGGPMAERLLRAPGDSAPTRRRESIPASVTRRGTDPFTVIWLTPLRALANDTAHALAEATGGLGMPWSIELRTSDTSTTVRKRQQDCLPTVLVTTPESLSLLISYPDARQRMASLRCAIVDEWHELLSTKRGVQAELGLARLRAWNPALRVWGLSATLANLEEAARVLTPPQSGAVCALIHARLKKQVRIDTLLPERIERFPWAGHIGARMVEPVAEALSSGGSTLVFCNTRSQAEIWFKLLMDLRPDWLGQVAIHHGSLDRRIRQQVEALLRAGKLRAVVCTSSLDLGVDFSAVDRVVQVGSPKGIARLMQRAGRSGHRPGQVSQALCVPTHAFELLEFSAAREGALARDVESRRPILKPLDVLAQHVVTIAVGGGFGRRELLDEVRATHAYAGLTDQEWGWVLDFVERGGPTLTAYPRFARVRRDPASDRYTVASPQVARLHRLGIGTITADGAVQLVSGRGKKLGTIEESFIGKLKPGDAFVFAGKVLELLSVRQMTARVRPAKRSRGTVPQWMGGRFPMSTQLAARVRQRLDEARRGVFVDDEMRRIAPLLAVQARWSALPAPGELLVESVQTREGGHHFLFPFLGRLVHEGLGAVLAHRIHRTHDVPVTATLTDYGIELHLPRLIAFDEAEWRRLLSPDRIVDDLLACLNAGELTKRQFREIARIAGLLVVGHPGQSRSNRQLQASSELFYEVFREFDPQNLLLEQARREVLEQQLEVSRLKSSLERLAAQRLVLKSTDRISPLAFPLWAQRLSSQTVRVENAQQRIDRMLRQLEDAMDAEAEVTL